MLGGKQHKLDVEISFIANSTTKAIFNSQDLILSYLELIGNKSPLGCSI